MKNQNTGSLGFTLIELLVVVLIIGILASVALPQYQKAVMKARAAEAWTNLRIINEALAIKQMEDDYQVQNYTFADLPAVFINEDGTSATDSFGTKTWGYILGSHGAVATYRLKDAPCTNLSIYQGKQYCAADCNGHSLCDKFGFTKQVSGPCLRANGDLDSRDLCFSND